MKNLFMILLSLGAIGYSGYTLYLSYLGPCGRPIEYSIGRFDSQFGVSEDLFKKSIGQAENVWEKALGKDIFVYNESAKFKVNLIFDERQQTTLQKQRVEFGLTASEDFFRKLDLEFENFKKIYDGRVKSYEQAVSVFENRQKDYELRVNSFNLKKEGSKDEYEFLQSELAILNIEAKNLNNEALNINSLTKNLNELLQKRNLAADEYNKIAKNYNKKYGHGLEFDQAEYTNNAINIYQFVNYKDLTLALTHEFGHALGMDHVENPKSIMYYVTNNDLSTILNPSIEDLAELKKVCKI